EGPSGPAMVHEPPAQAGPTHGADTRVTTITLLYGVRTAALLAGIEDFRDAGIAVEVATDDGTAGRRGFVTELLARRLGRGERPARGGGGGGQGSGGGARPPCWRRWRPWSHAMASLATSPWRITWPADSERASVASPRSVSPTARPTSAASASRGRWSPPS